MRSLAVCCVIYEHWNSEKGKNILEKKVDGMKHVSTYVDIFLRKMFEVLIGLLVLSH